VFIGSGFTPARRTAGGEDEHKLNNGVFSLMRLRRIKKPVTVHGLRGSGFNKNLKSPTSKLNKRNVTLNGEP